MKHLFLSLSLFFITLTLNAQTADTVRHEVLLETNKGDIRIALYNETLLHRDNFIKLVKEGFYDGVLFHRVISNFMIQAGDSASRHSKPGQALGNTPESYTVPAEIHFPQLFHKRGAVAAAREGDDINPKRESSAAHFYIVYGRRFSDNMLDDIQERLDRQTSGTVKLTKEIREVYKTSGGTPHLDGQYTVFGELVERLDVIECIQKTPTDANDRPLEDIRIIKAFVIK